MSSSENEKLNDVRAAAPSAVQAPQRSMHISCTLKKEMIEKMRANNNSGVVSLAELIDGFQDFNDDLHSQIKQATTPMDMGDHELYSGIMFSPTSAGIQFLSSFNESQIVGIGCSMAFITPREFHFHDAENVTQKYYGEFFKALNVANETRIAKTDIVEGKQCGKFFHGGNSHSNSTTHEIFNINYPSVPSLSIYGQPTQKNFTSIIEIVKKLEEKVGTMAAEKLPEFAYLCKDNIHVEDPEPWQALDMQHNLTNKFKINPQSYLATWMHTVHIIDKIPTDNTPLMINRNDFLAGIYTMAYAWGLHRNTTFHKCGITFDFKFKNGSAPVIIQDIHFVLQLDIKPIVLTKSKDMAATLPTNLQAHLEKSIMQTSAGSKSSSRINTPKPMTTSTMSTNRFAVPKPYK